MGFLPEFDGHSDCQLTLTNTSGEISWTVTEKTYTSLDICEETTGLTDVCYRKPHAPEGLLIKKGNMLCPL